MIEQGRIRSTRESAASGFALERVIQGAAKIRRTVAEVVASAPADQKIRFAWRNALVLYGLSAAGALGGYFIGGVFTDGYAQGAFSCAGAAAGLGTGTALSRNSPTLSRELEAVYSIRG